MKTYLITQYDARKSFYNKAVVEQTEKSIKLFSYNTLVAEIFQNEKKCKVYNVQSPTTLRHVKEFLKQNYFLADIKSQIIKDYMN